MNNTFLKQSLIRVINNSIFSYVATKLRKGALSLYYHGIEKEIINPLIQDVHLPLSQFERHLGYLRRNFEFISLDYLSDCFLSGHKIDPFQIIMTFDDGYKNILRSAVPLLQSYNIPFAVFVCTKHIDEALRFPSYYLKVAASFSEKSYLEIPSIEKKYYIGTQKGKMYATKELHTYIMGSSQKTVDSITRDLKSSIPENRWLELNGIFESDELMNWEDLKKLKEHGAVIGSHCHDHFIFNAAQSIEEIDFQLRVSKDSIEQHVGKCDYIAYPNGRVSQFDLTYLNLVKKNRYKLGFIEKGGEIHPNLNPFVLPRIGPSGDLDFLKFLLNTNSYFRAKQSRIYSKIEKYFNHEIKNH